jgi:hypothetical protein
LTLFPQPLPGADLEKEVFQQSSRDPQPFKLEDIDKSVNGHLTGGFGSFVTGQYFGGAQRGERNEKIQA